MNGGQVALAYNGLGQLVSKTVSGVTTQYLIDDLSPTGYSQVVEELTGPAATVTRTYTYGLERISESQTVSGAAAVSFYQYDGRGTVRMLTNAAGAVTDTYEYDAFGNLIASAGSTPNVYLYRDERWDADLGLYYLRARWYNPVTGRFMTRDPYSGSIYDPASLHRYNYAKANPVNMVDPSGRDAAIEIQSASWNVLKYAALAVVGYEIGCAYRTLAGGVQAVGEHLGQDILSLFLRWRQCNAGITVQDVAIGTASGLLGGWVLEGVGGAIGEALFPAELGISEGEILGPRLGGAGGSWPVRGEIPNPNVVQQANSLACGPACGEMLLSDSGVSQAQLGNGLTFPEGLAQSLNNFSEGWRGALVDTSSLGALNQTGSWAAMMYETGADFGHWVVVDGLSDAGEVAIRDPANATSYTMSVSDFMQSWTGGAVWNAQ